MQTFRDLIVWSSNTRIGDVIFARVWAFDQFLQRILRFADRHRSVQAKEDFYKRVRTKFHDQEVRHGPFKGLQYGDLQSWSSLLIPKLLGSYENELHPWFETVANKEYAIVVDIGCAEGYYAVGLARVLPYAQVYAYDIQSTARSSCKQMARLNGVADRVTVGAFCDPDTLRSLDLSSGALVISDCEGYEAELFNHEMVAHLVNADLIIECHDLIGKPITRNIIDVFSDTHKLTIIKTVADHCKALDLTLPELEGEPFPVRLYMVEERRSAPQNFLILEARNH